MALKVTEDHHCWERISMGCQTRARPASLPWKCLQMAISKWLHPRSAPSSKPRWGASVRAVPVVSSALSLFVQRDRLCGCSADTRFSPKGSTDGLAGQNLRFSADSAGGHD